MIKNCLKASLWICLNLFNMLHSSQFFSAAEEEVAWIRVKTSELSTLGYTQTADTLARQITQQLINPTSEKILSVDEADQHLRLELYYAFNTQWGTGKTKDHRIVYDFLSKLDKAAPKNPAQREFLSALTILSLASQEYFWNEKSTVIDLRNKAKRELRYGLFKKAGHKLNVSSLIYLEESDIERLTSTWISEDLLGKLHALMTDFRAKNLGVTFSAILDDLTTKLSKIGITKLPVELDATTREKFSLSEQMDFRPAPSAGDGICGENSLFIPTDGACGGISEGNARYKIERAVLDQAVDPIAHRLYLLISPHINNSEKFLEIIESHLASTVDPNEVAIREAIVDYMQQEMDLNAGRQEGASQQLRDLIARVAEPLSIILNRFKDELAKEEKLNAWTGNGADAFKDTSCRDFNSLIEEILNNESISPTLVSVIDPIRAEITRIMSQPGIQRPKKMAERNKLVGAALRSYLDADILPGTMSDKSFDINKLCEPGNERYSYLTSLCVAACRLVRPVLAVASSTEALIESEIAAIRDEKDEVIREIEHTLSMERLKILELFSNLPAQFSPDILREEMHKKALSPGELAGWLPCDAIYTQLWAMVNNLNIFVFSSGENHGRSGLDLMMRTKDEPYTQTATHYPHGTSGRHLATVILTSPTAKNVYLNKSAGHYDKFLSPNDLIAMARETRHLAWMKDLQRYALYP